MLGLFRLFFTALALAGLSGAAAGQETYVSEEQQRNLYEAGQETELPEVVGTTNLFSTALRFPYPKEWVPVYQVRQPGMFMMEYIPFGEDVRTNWTQMVTVQAFSMPQTRGLQPAQFARGWGRRMVSACSGESEFEELGAIDIEGATSYRVVFKCVGPDTSELTAYQVTNRNGDLIGVQFTMRSSPDGENVSDRRDYFVSLLDRLEFSDGTPAQPN
ncbi:MAG: hypothetical protein WA936_13975 [Erythrobacter sp.]|uniref:hypothetical protein n=1 Tax=Erythrobacter sp. TaxID=1042 RepID=UPI003C78C5D3